ncbi:MAG: zinc-binding alcohol dehydrogenase family protein [Planctomycetaceae bacterium]
MKSVILEKPEHFVLTDRTVPAALEAGTALVRVHRVGICGTDLHAYRGRQPFFSYPRILGHELGVEVVEMSNGPETSREMPRITVGDRCAVEPYINCGQCSACRRGKTNCCSSLQVLGVHTDGGMQEFIRVPIHKLHPSSQLSFDQLALVETLGIGAHAVERASLTQGENVLVIGAGPIGLSVIQFAQFAGVHLAVMDVNEQRLQFCSDRFHISHTIRPLDSQGEKLDSAHIETLILDRFSGELPTAVFDATGHADSMMQAFRYVEQGGRLTFVGLVTSEITFPDPEFHRREMTLMATRNSTADNFRRIIGWMETGQIDTTPWITHRASLTEMIGEFPRWLDPTNGVVKAMVHLD